MRIIFMGTGEIALPSFQALIESGAEVTALITQPDKPTGRHQTLTPPPLKPVAEAAGIPVLQPHSLKTEEALAAVAALRPDLLIVMAYGQILSRELLDIPRIGSVNLHASLLPRHRGASCIQAAISAGDQETGVTLMHIVQALDAGDIIARIVRPLSPQDTGEQVHDDLSVLAARLLMETLPSIEAGTALRQPQDEGLVTYAPKLLRHHGELDWSRPAPELERQIRAYSPWPGTYTMFTDARGKRKKLKIHPPVTIQDCPPAPAGQILTAAGDTLVVSCGSQALQFHVLQPEGGKMMTARAFLNGQSVSPGERFGA